MSRKSLLLLLSLIACLQAFGCSGGGSKEAADQTDIDLTGGKQGQSVGLADVDADLVDEKIVGAPYAVSGEKTGAVLVYKGTGGGYSALPTTVLTGDDNFGFSFVKMRGPDGDGKDDFAVGAINGSGDGAGDPSLSGTVSIYKGDGKWQLIRKLSGDGPMDKFGFSLASADLDNDGHADLIVGAPFNTNDPAFYQGGAVYVYFGPDFTRRVALYASSAASGLGGAVASGDINGDGIADLLISAGGKVLCFYGGKSFSPSVGTPDVVISSSAAGFGKAITVIGDLDGDGKEEIVIGAPNAAINGNRDTGSVYIVNGGDGKRTINLNSPSDDLIVRINGNSLFDRFGSSVVPLGDLDGDHKADFAVGAPMADVNVNDLSGKVYVFRGKDITAATTLASSTVFNGMTNNQAFGSSLASDMKGRLLIGGPRSNADTGGVMLVDAATGQAVPGGSSGGGAGGGGECH